MIVYAESSAVLAWLLAEPKGAEVRRLLMAADFVVTSDLTLVECDRAFHRAGCQGQLTSQEVRKLRGQLNRLAAGWILLRLGEEIVARARGAFPEEPIRSLDALHLATAINTAALIPETALLSLDERMRRCALSMGLRLLPAPIVEG